MPDFTGAATIGGTQRSLPSGGQEPFLVVPAEDLRGEKEPEVSFFSDALRQQWKTIKEKEAANGVLQQQLAAYDYVVDPSTFFSIMLSSLADTMFPDSELGQRMRFSWHELVQDRLAAGLRAAKSVVIQAALAQGANIPPAWIEELNREARSTK